MGFFGVFLYNVCFFTGLRTVPAGRASLMAALQPSVVFLFSAVVWGERITPLRITGLLISFGGALLVLSGGDLRSLFTTGLNSGDLWILGCVLSWVAYTLLGRTMAGRMGAGPTTAYSTWAGTVMLAALWLIRPASSPVWNARVVLAILFLGLLGTTVAFLLFLKGIGQIGASRASIFVNLVPVFGVLFSALILKEMPGASALFGGALVITGVRLLNR
jgi:drug/metabolite transporter (DMT)-like permease